MEILTAWGHDKSQGKHKNMCYTYWQIFLYVLYYICQEEQLHEKLFITGGLENTKG